MLRTYQGQDPGPEAMTCSLHYTHDKTDTPMHATFRRSHVRSYRGVDERRARERSEAVPCP